MLPFYEIQPDSLNIIYNARELYFPPHMHEHTEILYVYKVTQHLYINDIPYEINAGDAAIIFPDTLHNYYKDSKKYADAVIIICGPQILNSIFPNFKSFVPKNPIIKNEHLYEEVIYAFNHIKTASNFSAKLGWTYIIISYILDCLEMEKHSDMYTYNMTKSIMDYISINFLLPLTLDSIAKEFGVSKYYISRIFSDKIKMNFRNYLGVIRVEYAAKLIRLTNDSFTEISAKSGFESQRTFNRVFRSVYKMSPREYKYNIGKFIT